MFTLLLVITTILPLGYLFWQSVYVVKKEQGRNLNPVIVTASVIKVRKKDRAADITYIFNEKTYKKQVGIGVFSNPEFVTIGDNIELKIDPANPDNYLPVKSTYSAIEHAKSLRKMLWFCGIGYLIFFFVYFYKHG